MIIRSKAPLRVSFGGGGTDISPYIEKRGGAVISTTIDKYAYATLIPRPKNAISVKSLDYNIDVSFSSKEELGYDGKLDLVKAVVKAFKVKKGFDLVIHCDAPPGAGLGSSSTMTSALIGAIKKWLRLPLTGYEIAELAYSIERIELGIKGGKQDQYASVFGGINFIEFFPDRTIVNPLRIKREVVNELEYRLLLCYIGRSRLSSVIIEDQINGYVRGQKEVIKALDKTKDFAIAIKNALLLGNIDEVGQLIDEGWQAKKNFSKKITDSSIDELYSFARKNGAIGGKLLGAGGGGYLLLVCGANKRHKVIEALQKAGAMVSPFAFELRGLQTWSIG